MNHSDDKLTRTRLDKDLHRPRLKSGLVPHDTRICLRVTQGPDAGTTFDLSSGGCYIIGRRSGDIPLSDGKVSQRHAELKILGPDAYFLVDLASTNGTFLNGVRVDRLRFGHTDEIRIGDSLLVVDVIEGTLPVSGS